MWQGAAPFATKESITHVFDPAFGSGSFNTSFPPALVLAVVQGIEEGLLGMKKTLPPSAKAQLVVDVCALMAADTQGEGVSIGKVIPLLMQRLG